MAGVHRRALCLLALGAVASSVREADAAGLKPAAAARLPAVQLRVELRSVALPAAGPRPAEALKPGAVVVGTAGRVDANPGVTVRSGQPPADAAPVLQVVVANGERAVLRWQDEQVVPQFDFIWTPQGQGVTGGERLRLSSRQLGVQPTWVAEGEPVRLEISLDPGQAGTLAAQTVARVPLARWQAIARSAEAAPPQGMPPSGQAAASGGVELQVRVTLTGP